jgi:hypothetical protein
MLFYSIPLSEQLSMAKSLVISVKISMRFVPNFKTVKNVLTHDLKSKIVVIYNCNDSTIIIYNRNDSGLYYKTTIVAKYELKSCSKLKHNLQFYNCKKWS